MCLTTGCEEKPGAEYKLQSDSQEPCRRQLRGRYSCGTGQIMKSTHHTVGANTSAVQLHPQEDKLTKKRGVLINSLNSLNIEMLLVCKTSAPTTFPWCIPPPFCLHLHLLQDTSFCFFLVYRCTGKLDKYKTSSHLRDLTFFCSLFITETAESALCCHKVQLLRLLIMRIAARPSGTKVSTSQMHPLTVPNTLPQNHLCPLLV